MKLAVLNDDFQGLDVVRFDTIDATFQLGTGLIQLDNIDYMVFNADLD